MTFELSEARQILAGTPGVVQIPAMIVAGSGTAPNVRYPANAL